MKRIALLTVFASVVSASTAHAWVASNCAQVMQGMGMVSDPAVQQQIMAYYPQCFNQQRQQYAAPRPYTPPTPNLESMMPADLGPAYDPAELDADIGAWGKSNLPWFNSSLPVATQVQKNSADALPPAGYTDPWKPVEVGHGVRADEVVPPGPRNTISDDWVRDMRSNIKSLTPPSPPTPDPAASPTTSPQQTRSSGYAACVESSTFGSPNPDYCEMGGHTYFRNGTVQ